MATKKNKGKTKKSVRREERRFISQAATSSALVAVFGALSALLLGAGVWGFFYATSFASDEKLAALPQYILAGGAVLAGLTIWLGTSSEPPIRVGAPGIAQERGELVRMPWWGVDKITFDALALTVNVTGADESGAPLVIKVPAKVYPQGIAWVVKEALERIPRRVQIDESVVSSLPAAAPEAGERLTLEPLQVVGRKCAATGKTISYEPDARVCTRCERAYLAEAVPKKCKCGNSLAHLRPDGASDDSSDTGDDEDDNVPSSKKATAES